MSAMKKLRDLVTIKGGPDNFSDEKEPVSNATTSSPLHNELGMSIYQQAYGDSRNSNGAADVFRVCLNDVYEKFLALCRRDQEGQHRLNQPFQEELKRKETELNKRLTAKEIKENEVINLDSQIDEIDNSITDVRVRPEKYGIDADKRPKAQFYMGILVLLPITIYLVVFYMSASYSAFFKEFNDTQLSAAIFDANAFTKAYADGFLEGLFVTTIPFAFMGLGYLIHMFQKEGRQGRLKISALFLVTFIFDLILAYQIEKKIYEFEKTFDSEEFGFGIALQSPEFWGIIFAGFVVYVIWGLVFDFVMMEYENLDKIKGFIKSQVLHKKNVLERKQHVCEALAVIEHDVSELRGQMKELQSKIDGFIFPKRKYLEFHAEYSKGWFVAIAQELAIPQDRKDKLIWQCKEASLEHLEKYGVSENNAQNVIYTTDHE